MRLASYSVGRTRPQRAALRLTRALSAELDDVVKVVMRRPGFFGRPFLVLAHETLRGKSAWTAGEREFFAAVVSMANSCSFCAGEHSEISRLMTGHTMDEHWADGRFGDRATAVAQFLDRVTRDPDGVTPDDLARVREAGVDDDAVREALYVVLVFNTINRVADALAFTHRSDRDRLRGSKVLRFNGYRLPAILMQEQRG